MRDDPGLRPLIAAPFTAARPTPLAADDRNVVAPGSTARSIGTPPRPRS